MGVARRRQLARRLAGGGCALQQKHEMPAQEEWGQSRATEYEYKEEEEEE